MYDSIILGKRNPAYIQEISNLIACTVIRFKANGRIRYSTNTSACHFGAVFLIFTGTSQSQLRVRHAIIKKTQDQHLYTIQRVFDSSDDQTRIRFAVYLLEFADADGSGGSKTVDTIPGFRMEYLQMTQQDSRILEFTKFSRITNMTAASATMMATFIESFS